MANNENLRKAIMAMKAGKILSNALGTSPTETPDVAIPKKNQTVGEQQEDKDKEGEDGGGGSEQAYQQSDQPNGGQMGQAGPRTARSGSYLRKRY